MSEVNVKYLKPFFRFYGSKNRIAGYYPKPVHGMIIEPFAGAAGYSHRYYWKQVHLNDIDPVIAGIWQYLIQVKESEILALPSHVVDKHTLHKYPLEACSLIGFWLNPGATHPCKNPSKWANSYRPGRKCEVWGDGAKHRIASQLQYIRHWTITNWDYETLDNETADWFIDPPYNSPAGRRYRHSTIDYRALAQWCRARSGQTIVCEGAGATWLPFTAFRESMSQKVGGKFTELIWHRQSGA